MSKENELKVEGLEFTRQMGGGHNACVILSLRPAKKQSSVDFLLKLHKIHGVEVVTEL